MKTVLLGLMSNGRWEADFGLCLTQLCVWTVVNADRLDLDFQIFHRRGTSLSELRHGCADKALDCGAQYLLFIDTDQTFPQDLIPRLLKHDKQIVACNIPVKRTPSVPTARLYEKGNHKGKILYSTPDSPELQRVWRVGTGIMLINTKVFHGLPRPWFPVTWSEENEAYTGEDWGFCQLVERYDYPIYVDHKTSLEIGHIGQYKYTHEDVIMEKEMYDGLRRKRDADFGSEHSLAARVG